MHEISSPTKTAAQLLVPVLVTSDTKNTTTLHDASGREYDIRPWGEYVVLDDQATDHKVKRITIQPAKRLSYQRHTKRALFAKVIDRTEYENTAEVSYSLGDLVFLLTGSRDEKIDQRDKDRKAVAKKEQDLKRHARVTLYKNKGKNRYSDDFFDDGSTAIVLEDFSSKLPAAHPGELLDDLDDLDYELNQDDDLDGLAEEFDVALEDEDL